VCVSQSTRQKGEEIACVSTCVLHIIIKKRWRKKQELCASVHKIIRVKLRARGGRWEEIVCVCVCSSVCVYELF